MKVIIEPSEVFGSITAPAGKSSMQRSCAAALLARGTTHIINPGVSNDDKAALGVIETLGAQITRQDDGSLLIKSEGVKPTGSQINCGESGLGIRMFAPIAALSDQPVTINGSGSLLKRPMDFFDDIFPALNISIRTNKGRLPVWIKGPLKPANISIDGSLSSQFLTGLLMAFGYSVTEPVSIAVNNLKSKPYIDLTLQVMQAFGRKVTHENYKTFLFEPQQINYQPCTYVVEGDWSGAAFLFVAGAVAGNICVEGLDVNSTQADRMILKAIEASNAKLIIEGKNIWVSNARLNAFHFNATDCPDLFPPLVALASFCNGTSEIKGTTRLTHKESNRALTLQEEFFKLGVTIVLENDIMFVRGVGSVKAATIHSRHDHRIAMACAIAALRSEGRVEIEEAGAIDKSYPGFYDDLKTVGVNLEQY